MSPLSYSIRTLFKPRQSSPVCAVPGSPNVHMYCSQLVTVLNFVRGGKCGAFLYSSLATNPRDFVVIPVSPEITSKFGIIWKKGVFVPDQLTKFVKFIQEYDVTPYLPKL